jgi:xanthine dehydrogenase accessory factor
VSLYEVLRDCLAGNELISLATVVAIEDVPSDETEPPTRLGAKLLVRPGHEPLGSLGNEGLDEAVARDLFGSLQMGRTTTRHYGWRGEVRSADVSVFFETFAPPPKLVIFGAMDFAAALARNAKLLGYHVTVCDPRTTFATRKRFPMVDVLAIEWPNRFLEREGPTLNARDAVCVLTHDPKFDIPAIVSALATAVGYLGAMGSRRTTADRNKRLLEAGANEGELERVMAPIGLDIGARTPEETAVSICAEIIANRAGDRNDLSLRNRTGPIHTPPE